MVSPQNDICCIGHATVDRVITPESTRILPGGTAYYFSTALRVFDIRLTVATAFAEQDRALFDQHDFNGDGWTVFHGQHSHFFENKYSANRDYRQQRVLGQGSPFLLADLVGIQADWYHFGPLLAGDIPTEIFSWAAEQGKVSLDVQGCIRRVDGAQVVPQVWEDADKVLPLVTTLKANYEEARLLTGRTRIKDCIAFLERYGVAEIIITLGSNGAVIHTEGKSRFIPAFTVRSPRDTTGCGDTFMAGYHYSRIKGAGVCEAGQFAAAMAALKVECHGPFTGTEQDVMDLCSAWS